MNINRSLVGLLIAAAALFGCIVSASETRIIDVAGDRETTLPNALADLKKNRIIFIGEIHDQERHHQFQLDVIKALHTSGTQVAIGMEMFRKDSQGALDRWVSGGMSDKEFQSAYNDNWNYPWSLYSDILVYARAEKIPVVGLNVSKGVTRQVARSGFQSLDAKQKEALPLVTCHVDKNYMDFIKESYGMHGHGKLNFTYFCEAQLVWDKAMAVHVLGYLYRRPNTLMVVVAGRGHAQKMGIPSQVGRRSSLPYAVMLPQRPEGLVTGPDDGKDADYFFQSP